MACKACGKIISHPKSQKLKASKGSLAQLKQHSNKCTAVQIIVPDMGDYLASGFAKASDIMFSKRKFEEAQVNLAIQCSVPFTTFDSPWFKQFIAMVKLAPKKELTLSCKTVAARLHALARNARDALRAELKKNKSCCAISLDGWTAPNGIPFVGIVIHFIDNSFQLRREVLAFDLITGTHTGERYAELVWEILVDYKLIKKV